MHIIYFTHYGLYSKFSNKSMIYTLFIGVLNVIEATPITSYATTSRLYPPPPPPTKLSGGGGGVEASCCCLPLSPKLYHYTRVAICVILLYNCLHVNLDIFIWLYYYTTLRRWSAVGPTTVSSRVKGRATLKNSFPIYNLFRAKI